MDKPLWKFKDQSGTFLSENACGINTLYFPLCNNYPIMSCVTADLRGDLKTGYNSFLLEPVSRVDISNLKSSRNFWIYLNKSRTWSATGVSKDFGAVTADKFRLEAGLLWQKITRQNNKIGLKSEITSFVPSSGEPVEIMYVEITNVSAAKIKFIPTAAIPVYARSAANLHDHRHVTSLLNRVEKKQQGIIVTPTLLFDESGHRNNFTSYFVFGSDEDTGRPEYMYPTQEEFTGDQSDLEAPVAVINNLLPGTHRNSQGKEALAGLRFKAKSIKPKQKCAYIIVMGIVNDKSEINGIFKKFNTREKILTSLNITKDYWQNKAGENGVNTPDPLFDNWIHWVSIQPTLRKIFGCSFLPDFDYGKGGRGWRDLWQDCLSLILTAPEEVRHLIVNNFSGVRIDGSNATIIGSKPGEFIADRNNISRVWMDHGIWPLITTLLYIHQTSDLAILSEEVSYFKDHQICRGNQRDWDWKPEYGKELKTVANRIYKGTILEHILTENLVQFFNVGPHNHIRLEGADWNDGLDMAKENGESVAFTALYAQNLNILCDLIDKSKEDRVEVLRELAILLDSLNQEPVDYSDINQKQKLLDNYFQAVKSEVSGEKISLPKESLKQDLKKKADWISAHIKDSEWLAAGFFNGYYDNDKQRVEGKHNGLTRMTLTGQVFPVMSGIAEKEQIKMLFDNCRKYLQDKKLGGFRLNTDFGSQQRSLGRAFSFVYGDKENGAFFNHMAVMFSYALYKRGFVGEGFEVLNSIFQMAVNTQKSKIYPCLPEYFNLEGRGMYSYLTGSASWFMLTLITQVFGVRGEYGDLVIEPKLTARQFKSGSAVNLNTFFCGKKFTVKFINASKKEYGSYSIKKVIFNEKTIEDNIGASRFIIPRQNFVCLAVKPLNIIEVILD